MSHLDDVPAAAPAGGASSTISPSSSGWLKIHSTARSTLLSVSFSALMHFFSGIPMLRSVAKPSGLGVKEEEAGAALNKTEGFLNIDHK